MAPLLAARSLMALRAKPSASFMRSKIQRYMPGASQTTGVSTKAIVGFFAFIIAAILTGLIVWYFTRKDVGNSPPPPSGVGGSSQSESPSSSGDGTVNLTGYQRTVWAVSCTSDACKALKTDDIPCYSGRPSWDICYVNEVDNPSAVCDGLEGCGGYKCGTLHGGNNYCFLLDTVTAQKYWSSGMPENKMGKTYIKNSTKG